MQTYKEACAFADEERAYIGKPDYPVTSVAVRSEVDGSWVVQAYDANGTLLATFK